MSNRRQSSNLGPVVALVAVGLATVVAVGVAGYALRNGDPASAGGSDTNPTVPTLSSRSSEEWNHAELLQYLNARGLRLGMKDAGGEAFVYHSTATVTDRHIPAASIDLAMLERSFDSLQDEGLIKVSKLPSAQAARDAAGLKQERGWSWGRFLFIGNPKLIAEIRETLS